MNLSDHSQSIHKQIAELRHLTTHLKVQDDLGLDKWLKSLGLGPWLTSIIQHLISLGIIVLLAIICISCFCQCLQKMIHNATEAATKQALLVQKEKGGIIEEWLESQGHGSLELLWEQTSS